MAVAIDAGDCAQVAQFFSSISARIRSMLSKPYSETDRHPVPSLRCTEWAFPRPGTRERFAVISHLQGEDGCAFWAVTVAGERLGPFPTLEDAAMRVHKAAIAASVRPELNEAKR
jgi:hypothetical protein